MIVCVCMSSSQEESGMRDAAMNACLDDDRLHSTLDPKMSLSMTLITGSAHRPHHLLLLVKEWTLRCVQESMPWTSSQSFCLSSLAERVSESESQRQQHVQSSENNCRESKYLCLTCTLPVTPSAREGGGGGKVVT